MSKSDDDQKGTIALLDDPDAVRNKFRRAVTDSGMEIRFDRERPAIMNLLTIYQLLTGKTREEIEDHFAGKGYAQLKAELAEVTIEFLRPLQERIRAISDEELDRILAEGAERARSIASETYRLVKERVGLVGARNFN